MMGVGICIGVALFLAWKARDAWFRLEEGHVGLVTRFGAARHRPDGALLVAGPGLHFKWPFEEIKVVSMRELTLNIAGDASEAVMLHDGTVIRLQAMLRYAPKREGLARYVFGLAHRREHVTGLFSSLLRNEVANVAAPARTENALTAPGDELGGAFALVRRDRRILSERISEFAQRELGDQYGVDFRAVDVTDIHPPDELADALNGVMRARAEADAARFRAEGECAQRLLAAEGGVRIAQAKAEALEAEIDELGRHLAVLHETGVLDAYVARREAEVLSESRTLFVKEGSET
jgi:regulator of protease activity HflC (stomatin/prohibitin superfamily)